MGKRVVVADDAAIMRSMIKTILVENGFEVVAEAADGVEAVEKFEQYNPDLITMDIVMPKLDGINAVKQIIAAHPDAKIMMCSSLGQQQMVVDAIRAGAKAFITKPFEAPKLLETVNRLAARKRSRKRNKTRSKRSGASAPAMPRTRSQLCCSSRSRSMSRTSTRLRSPRS